jgi:MFS family permease
VRDLLALPAAAGLASVVVANFVMVAIMAMAPVQMEATGHSLRLVGLAVSLHVAGMFAPAPLTGWLTDRVGALRVAPAGGGVLVLAGVISAIAGGALPFTVGIVLLGVGELSMGVAAGCGTALAGPLMGAAGYAALAVVSAIAAATLVAVLLAAARRGAPAATAPAPRMLT